MPHNKLKNVMRELINFCFKGGKNQFIAVTKFTSTCTEKASLKLVINFLLDNCFFNIVNLFGRHFVLQFYYNLVFFRK